jgi:hypothetical protein
MIRLLLLGCFFPKRSLGDRSASKFLALITHFGISRRMLALNEWFDGPKTTLVFGPSFQGFLFILYSLSKSFSLPKIRFIPATRCTSKTDAELFWRWRAVSASGASKRRGSSRPGCEQLPSLFKSPERTRRCFYGFQSNQLIGVASLCIELLKKAISSLPGTLIPFPKTSLMPITVTDDPITPAWRCSPPKTALLGSCANLDFAQPAAGVATLK